MTFVPYLKGISAYNGIRVGPSATSISQSAYSRMLEPRRLLVQIDKETNCVLLTSTESEKGYRVSRSSGSSNFICTVRLSRVMPEGRYSFKEQMGDGYIFELENDPHIA